MTLEQAYFIAEITAAFAVVISIFYLGVQIRNTRIQNKKEMHLDLSKFRSEILYNLSSDVELSYIVAQGLAGKLKMNPNEYFRFSNFAFCFFIAYEIAYQRNLSKDLESNVAGGVEESLKWWLRFPGIQTFWKNNREFGFSLEFKDYVDAFIRSIKDKEDRVFEYQVAFMESAGNRSTSSKKDLIEP